VPSHKGYDNRRGVTVDHILPASVMGRLRTLANAHSKELIKVVEKPKTYHGKSLISIICTDCGHQHTTQVVDGSCLDIKACEKRQKAWK